MTQDEIIKKLKELGINSTNTYPKKIFAKNGESYIGCYSKELQEDFYFYSSYDKKIYCVPFDMGYKQKYEKEMFQGDWKYQIPIVSCTIAWEEKPVEKEKVFEEQDDEHFSKMTIRDFYCILYEKPRSNKKWINNMIIKG